MDGRLLPQYVRMSALEVTAGTTVSWSVPLGDARWQARPGAPHLHSVPFSAARAGGSPPSASAAFCPEELENPRGFGVESQGTGTIVFEVLGAASASRTNEGLSWGPNLQS